MTTTSSINPIGGGEGIPNGPPLTPFFDDNEFSFSTFSEFDDPSKARNQELRGTETDAEAEAEAKRGMGGNNDDDDDDDDDNVDGILESPKQVIERPIKVRVEGGGIPKPKRKRKVVEPEPEPEPMPEPLSESESEPELSMDEIAGGNMMNMMNRLNFPGPKNSKTGDIERLASILDSSPDWNNVLYPLLINLFPKQNESSSSFPELSIAHSGHKCALIVNTSMGMCIRLMKKKKLVKNFAEVEDYCIRAGVAYPLMEGGGDQFSILRGVPVETLGSVIHRNGLPLSKVVDLLQELMVSLERGRITFGDLHLGNIVLGSDGKVYVFDFTTTSISAYNPIGDYIQIARSAFMLLGTPSSLSQWVYRRIQSLPSFVLNIDNYQIYKKDILEAFSEPHRLDDIAKIVASGNKMNYSEGKIQ